MRRNHLPLTLLAIGLTQVGGTACIGTNTEQLFGTQSGRGKKDPLTAGDERPGCLIGVALDTSRIRIEFEFPETADRVRLYRDGIEIMASTDRGATTYTDTRLNEGQTYRYTCEMSYKGAVRMGTRVLNIPTKAENAPVFAGVATAAALSPNSVKVTWLSPSSSGVPATSYKIYANAGSTLSWDAAPRAELEVGTNSYTITGLGDELPYVFGVEACSSGGFCARGTASGGGDKTLAVVTPDGGAPQTIGAASASTQNSNVILTAPWTEPAGGLKRRRVYMKSGAFSATLGDFTLALTTAPIADPTTPPTSLTVNGILENTQYHFIIQDEDPTGNLRLTPVLSFMTGDLTPPAFGGAGSAVLGNPADTKIDLSFTAVNRQWPGGEDTTNGAAYYLVYLSSVPYTTYQATPGALTDACSSGSLWGSPISTETIAPGARTLGITGLTERTTYSICMKARDFAGNISTGSTALVLTTRDVTPPAFDGVQTISFDNTTSELVLGWNPSTAADIKEYKVRLWKNAGAPDLAPAGGSITDFIRSHGAPHNATTGARFSNSDYALGDNEYIHALVLACDTAAALPGGSQNCSTFAFTVAKYMQLPDITPPAGFAGIKGSGFQVSTVNAQATIAWFEPTWTADYYGFKVFHYNGSNLQLLKDCPCATPGACNAGDVSCTVTALDPYRTYTFHVRAVDAAGNQTQLNPATSQAQKRVADTVAPTFASSLTIGASPTFTLNWSAATDNQYAAEPGVAINYKIYRKAGSTFAAPSNPSADGTLRATTSNTTYNDNTFTEGQSYYYTVCAVDSSNNTTCDGFVRSMTVPDITPPTIGSFTSNHNSLKKRWDLSWTMSDNFDVQGNLNVEIYQKNTVGAPGTATTSDAQVYSNTGTLTAPNLSGPINVNRYVNYLLVVRDIAGNQATQTLSVLSNNAMTVTSVSRSTGPTAGGNLILIQGTGFSKGAQNAFGTDSTVSLGIAACTGVTVIDAARISCTVPAAAAASYDVTVTNPEGSSATLGAAYTYESIPTHICDNPGTWGSEMAAGAGTVGDPYQICTRAHLDMLRNNNGQNGATVDYRTGNKHFKLMDHIDLGPGGAFTPIAGLDCPTTSCTTQWEGTLDGNNLVIMNFSYSNATGDGVGLFGGVKSGTIKNLGILNANVTGRMNTGVLLGLRNGAGSFTIDNVYAMGTVSGTQYTGGLVGQLQSATNTVQNSWSAATVAAGTDHVGGLVGRAYDTDFVSAYAEGNVTSTGNYVGGLIGMDDAASTITTSYATGVVNASGATGNVGGLIGDNAGSVSGSYATGAVTSSHASATKVGGLVGNVTSGGIANSYSTGAVTGQNNGVGGLIGWTIGSTVTNSYHTTGTVTGANYVGGIVGYRNSASLYSGVYSTSAVSGVNNVGGVVGYNANAGTIASSYATGPITASGVGAGGLIGSNNANVTVNDSYATGNVTASYYVGGVIGETILGAFYRCYATGNVTAVHGTNGYAGGFGGFFRSRAEDSYATGNVTVTGNFAGGFAGLDQLLGGSMIVLRSYATGNVIGNSLSSDKIGGFVGSLQNAGGTVEDSYATGSVTGKRYIGGFVGEMTTVSTANWVRRSYATGSVSGVQDVNGFLALKGSANSTLEKNYWNTTTTGQATSVGSGAGASEGKTTAEMQNQAAPGANGIYGVAGAAWDFSTPVWKWCAGSGVYPVLNTQTCPP